MQPDFIFICQNNCFIKISLASILYIRYSRSLVELITPEHLYQVHYSLDHLWRYIPPLLFCQVNPECFAAVGKISSFDANHVYLPGTRIPLTASYAAMLKNRVRILGKNTGPLTHRIFIDRNGQLFGI